MKTFDETEAKTEHRVMPLYQDKSVAEKYIDNRFNWSWSRLLHDTQVKTLNASIKNYGANSVLEIAPGPARLTTEIKGFKKGVMVEASEEMIDIAEKRLESENLFDKWEIRHGNAFDLSELPDNFDLAYSFRFIRHFDVAERERLYSQISSRLKQNGILIFDVVNKEIRRRIDELKPENTNLENLPVYDAAFFDFEIRDELDGNGFKIELLVPVIKHYFFQSWLSYKFDTRLPRIASLANRFLEKTPTNNPLEWIAICKKSR